MGLDRDALVGLPTGAATVHVERGPVSQFARALTDANPVYQSLDAAREAGFDSIPAPPTFPFAAAHGGTFPEDQPEDPTADQGNPMREIMGDLMAQGGLVLHGSRSFCITCPYRSARLSIRRGRSWISTPRKPKARP